jgi:hypothetical protein
MDAAPPEKVAAMIVDRIADDAFRPGTPRPYGSLVPGPDQRQFERRAGQCCFLNFAAVVFHGVLRTREICRRRTLTAPVIVNPSNR